VPVLVGARVLATEGAPSSALVVFTDITERKRAEEALRRQNRELATLNAIAATISQSLDLNRTLGAVLDKVLEMVKVDAGWIQMIAENDQSLSLVVQRGMPADMVDDLKQVQVGRGLLARVIRTRKSATISSSLPGSEADAPGVGEELWALCAIPIQARETVLGVLTVLSHRPHELSAYGAQTLAAIGHQIGVAVENTRLLEEAAQAEILREVDRFRSELVANVSHELRTPLGLIKIFCTTLMREDVAFDRETQLEFLQDIERETNHLEEIVTNLLDVSRMESGRLYLEKQPTDLGLLVDEVVGELRNQPGHYQIACDFPDRLIAPVDRGRLAQVLRNLLSNAIKYSPDGTKIAIRGRREGHQAVVSVQDQGIGIPAEDLERVFERFYRVENETTRNVAGVGLGLSVCQGIVRAHGGRIWVESTLGEGSTFFFSVPTAPTPMEPPIVVESNQRSER